MQLLSQAIAAAFVSFAMSKPSPKDESSERLARWKSRVRSLLSKNSSGFCLGMCRKFFFSDSAIASFCDEVVGRDETGVA